MPAKIQQLFTTSALGGLQLHLALVPKEKNWSGSFCKAKPALLDGGGKNMSNC